MDEMMLALLQVEESGAMLEAVNERLAVAGIFISREDALTLTQRRAESLEAVERVEFGAPAVTAIAEAVANSPFLMQENVGDVLVELQDAFYALRDELPVDVPDAEIVEALQGCFDACEGEVGEVAMLPKESVMAFSREYRLSLDAVEQGEYRIVDDEGRVYAFNSAEWDHDEMVDGWDGERWSDDFGD